MDSSSNSLWVLGSTGLVGKACIDLLQSDYPNLNVIAPIRREPTIPYHVQVDFENVEFLNDLPIPKSVICSIGTTIAKAGTKENFRRIEHDLVVQLATFLKNKGVSNFLYVSSIGADIQSNIFYLKTKGEIEESLKKLNFDSLYILRPSSLDGPREEFRFAEQLSVPLLKLVSPILIGSLKKLKVIHANVVAKALIDKALHPDKGFYIFESDILLDQYS